MLECMHESSDLACAGSARRTRTPSCRTSGPQLDRLPHAVSGGGSRPRTRQRRAGTATRAPRPRRPHRSARTQTQAPGSRSAGPGKSESGPRHPDVRPDCAGARVNAVFADPSAIVKLYADEVGAEAVRAAAPTIISQLARVEVPTALWRKHRMGESGVAHGSSSRGAPARAGLIERDRQMAKAEAALRFGLRCTGGCSLGS
jgi:hypothetical protein